MPVLGNTEGPVVSTPEPGTFAKDWLAASNSLDVEAVLNYRSQSGALVNEVLDFDDGLMRRGHGTYLVRT
jgi:hypothetical protein